MPYHFKRTSHATYGFLVTAAQPELGVREKSFLTKAVDIHITLDHILKTLS